MATGEGKTLVATLPAYVNALTGEGKRPEWRLLQAGAGQCSVRCMHRACPNAPAC